MLLSHFCYTPFTLPLAPVGLPSVVSSCLALCMCTASDEDNNDDNCTLTGKPTISFAIIAVFV